MSVEQTVKNFILENYLFTDDQSALDINDSFMDKGVVDSTGMMEIIFFLEDEYNIAVADKEMISDNLDSISNIVNFIARKKQ